MKSLVSEFGMATAFAVWLLYMFGYYDMGEEQIAHSWEQAFHYFGY